MFTELDLFSDCACGRRYHIRVRAPALAVGLGIRVTAGFSDVAFDDGQAWPDPTRNVQILRRRYHAANR